MHTRMFIVAAALFAVLNVSHSAPLREQQFQLSIESGSLASVLKQFSRQTGLHIGAEITVNNSRVHTFGPFVGHATADDAMKELLRSSGLWYAWRADDTIRLFHATAQRTNWSSGAVTAKEASESIQGLAGVHYETGICSDYSVGPFSSDEPMTAEAFWVELIKEHCPVIPKRSSEIEPGSVDRLTVAGTAEHSFDLPELPRILLLRRIGEQTAVDVDYLSTDDQEEQALVGPLSGSMSLNQALKLATRDSVLRIRWVGDDTVSVEPAYTVAVYADMKKCRCSFGLPEMKLLETEDIEVEESRLPPISEFSQAPVKVLDRAFIEASGASTIPELLSYLTQQSFNHSRTFRANAAQYFEGRGFGAQYPLVLIDGHRAYGSAGDAINNAFDLNMIPLSAVERLDVALDQPSLRYGTDAIGGTVNIVLRRAFERNAAAVSLASAQGGADRNRATLLADHQWQWQNTKAGFVFDHLAQDHLLGSERGRWRSQDYRRYGGQDLRLHYGVPPTVSLINDADSFPGFDARSAVLGPGGLTLRPDDGTTWGSPQAYAAIEPKQERTSLYGFVQTRLGAVDLRFGMLLGDQKASLQLFPESVEDLQWGKDHPQNPFDFDVNVSTLLTGLPPRMQEATSTLQRYSIDLKGFVGRWEYSAFFATHDDKSRVWITNQVDHEILAQSLNPDDSTIPLNVLTDRPGEGHLPARLLLPHQVAPYKSEAMEFGGNLSGSLFARRAINVEADVGVARRLEAARFDPSVARSERDVTSIFSRLRVPIVGTSGPMSLRDWEINAGARRDFYQDVPDVTTWQGSVALRPRSGVKFHAAYTTLYRPPSLYELHQPSFEFPFVTVDPRSNESVAVTLVSGGNSSLHPTEGEAIDVGLTYQPNPAWNASLKYWDTRMSDRISPVLFSDLINAPSDVGDLITRDPVTGQLLSLNTSQANFGAAKARGFDGSVEYEFKAGRTRITPGIDLTHTMSFQYRDLPEANSRVLNRAGIASLYGTIPSWRAVGSLTFERGRLSAALFARYYTPYRDDSIVEGAVVNREISAKPLWDFRITADIGDRFTVSLGANNVLDEQPPYAPIGDVDGFDSSQGDLIGREVFLDITGSF